jgi:hypothetical protein
VSLIADEDTARRAQRQQRGAQSQQNPDEHGVTSFRSTESPIPGYGKGTKDLLVLLTGIPVTGHSNGTLQKKPPHFNCFAIREQTLRIFPAYRQWLKWNVPGDFKKGSSKEFMTDFPGFFT